MTKLRNLLFLIIILCLLNGCVKKDNQIKIQFASWGSQSEVEIIKPILADFEKQNPNIKVEFVHIPQNYFQKIHLLFASNLAPDVLFINNLYLPFFANAGVLEELNNEKILNKISIKSSSFYPKALKSMSFNDKLYAIPRDVSNLVIYLNKDLFKKYNVALPNQYWTFNDLLIITKKITRDTNNDGKTDIWGISFDEEPALFYLPYLMSEGGGILSDDSKKIIINSPQSQKGLIFYADLRNKYHVAPTRAESASATMAQMFLQEKIAMHLSGRWLVPKYKTDANFDWNVINFPKGEEGSIVPLDASGWAISKSSKHKKEAAKLIEFLASKESIEKFSNSGLIVPARIDVAEGGFMFSVEDINPPLNNYVFINAIKTSKPTPVSVDYNKVQDELKKRLDIIFNSN